MVQARQGPGRDGHRNQGAPALHVFRRAQEHLGHRQAAKSLLERMEQARHAHPCANVGTVVGDRQHVLGPDVFQRGGQAFDGVVHFADGVVSLQWRREDDLYGVCVGNRPAKANRIP
ncbi:hypothetical protein D3C73_591830 [compost metagenome]